MSGVTDTKQRLALAVQGALMRDPLIESIPDTVYVEATPGDGELSTFIRVKEEVDRPARLFEVRLKEVT